jgi:hypothetical protein
MAGKPTEEELRERDRRARRSEEFWHDVAQDDRRRLIDAARLMLVIVLVTVLVAFTALAWWLVSGL